MSSFTQDPQQQEERKQQNSQYEQDIIKTVEREKKPSQNSTQITNQVSPQQQKQSGDFLKKQLDQVQINPQEYQNEQTTQKNTHLSPRFSGNDILNLRARTPEPPSNQRNPSQQWNVSQQYPQQIQYNQNQNTQSPLLSQNRPQPFLTQQKNNPNYSQQQYTTFKPLNNTINGDFSYNQNYSQNLGNNGTGNNNSYYRNSRSPSPSRPFSNQKQSQAYVQAMKALQQKIKQIEGENNLLIENCEGIERQRLEQIEMFEKEIENEKAKYQELQEQFQEIQEIRLKEKQMFENLESSLKEKLISSEKEYHEQKQQNQLLQNEIQELEKAHSFKNKLQQDWLQEKQDLKNTISQLESQVSRFTGILKEKDQSIQKLEENIAFLEKNLEEANEKYLQVFKENEIEKREHAVEEKKMYDHISALQNEKQNQIQDKHFSEQQKQQQLDQLNQQIQELKNQHTRIRNKSQESQLENSRLKGKIQFLERENQYYKGFQEDDLGKQHNKTHKVDPTTYQNPEMSNLPRKLGSSNSRSRLQERELSNTSFKSPYQKYPEQDRSEVRYNHHKNPEFSLDPQEITPIQPKQDTENSYIQNQNFNLTGISQYTGRRSEPKKSVESRDNSFTKPNTNYYYQKQPLTFNPSINDENSFSKNNLNNNSSQNLNNQSNTGSNNNNTVNKSRGIQQNYSQSSLKHARQNNFNSKKDDYEKIIQQIIQTEKDIIQLTTQQDRIIIEISNMKETNDEFYLGVLRKRQREINDNMYKKQENLKQLKRQEISLSNP